MFSYVYPGSLTLNQRVAGSSPAAPTTGGRHQSECPADFIGIRTLTYDAGWHEAKELAMNLHSGVSTLANSRGFF
jgi:hypothetical protein